MERSDSFDDLGIFLNFFLNFVDGLLFLVEYFGLDASFGFQSGDDILIFPSDVVRESSHGTEFSTGFQSQDFKSGRNNHSFLFVVGRRNAFESLESFKSVLSAFGFVGNHSSNDAEENLGRRSVMERTSRRFNVAAESQKLKIL